MISSLVSYDTDDDSQTEIKINQNDDKNNFKLIKQVPYVNSYPDIDESMIVEYKEKYEKSKKVNLDKPIDLEYNPKYKDLFSQDNTKDILNKNFLTGHVEKAYIDKFQFEEERKLFHFKGQASNPSDNSNVNKNIQKGISSSEIGATVKNEQVSNENNKVKRKRLTNDNPSDVENFVGPWAPFENEISVSIPNEKEKEEIDEYLAKKKKVVYQKDKIEEEKSTLHISDPYDYQGRSFLHAPLNLDVNLKYDHIPDKCYIPKKCIQVYTGHSKAVSAIRWFPVSAHLFLSAGMDNKIKLWEVYNERRCILTYLGHKQAVRDICFNRSGERFVSCGYDKALKLWDTETGQCIKRFENRKIAYCVKFNTDYEASHLFLTGMSDKKILCWDSRSGSVVQEYDRHLGAINTINFVDNNRRFVTTSDDKSLRVWEWDIPVDIKYIADPSMHAIPAVSPAPNGKWLACQFMDNKIQAFACLNRFKLNNKKVFKGHMVAGYACVPDFSPEMSYIISGDADGKIFVWDWKTTKLITSFKAHDNVCINVLWHPHETSKVLSCGWDNLIKLWD